MPTPPRNVVPPTSMSKPTPDPAPSATILIVDDLHENLEVLGTFLESAGHQVLAASNGADALRIAERARPDIVLLDVVMPGLDGLETCRQLKSAPGTREIPVVFITARDDVGAVVAGFDAGGVDYVAKPF